MRAGHDLERSGSGSVGVELHAHGDQLFEHRDRRLRVQHALLLPPAGVTRRLDTARDGNAEVLVRADRPLRVGRLREQRALHANGTGRQQRYECGMCTQQRREFANFRNREQIARAGAVDAGQQRDRRVAFGGAQQRRQDHCAVAVERFHGHRAQRRPMIDADGTGPNSRLSALFMRLSPST